MMIRSSRITVIALTMAALAAFTGTAADAADSGKDAVRDRGRYVVTIAGCNDCHTPGYAVGGGNVDEKQWLTGDSLGPAGEPAPAFVPPNQEPRPPYVTFPAPPPK